MENTTINVEVIGLKLIGAGTSPLKAIANVQVGEWSVFNWRIIQQNGHRAQVFTPQTAWVGPGGQIKYRALLSIPGALRQRIEVAILSAWEKEKENEHRPTTPRN